MPDIAEALRTAILNSSVIDDIPEFEDNGNSIPNVYTRSPAPARAPFPMILVSPDLMASDVGGLNDTRWNVMRQITIVTRNETAAKYRLMEQKAYEIRTLFHGQRRVISVPNYHVVDIWATGPIPVPSEDDMLVGRLVRLEILLQEL